MASEELKNAPKGTWDMLNVPVLPRQMSLTALAAQKQREAGPDYLELYATLPTPSSSMHTPDNNSAECKPISNDDVSIFPAQSYDDCLTCLFDTLDRDVDGKITAEDYRYLLRAMSYATLSEDCPEPDDLLIEEYVFDSRCRTFHSHTEYS